MKIPAKELSLRPYNGRLFVAKSVRAYEKAHKMLFKTEDKLEHGISGRFYGEANPVWTYLVYAEEPAYLAHEISHVVFHTFERVGIDPTQADNEPFCYMLSQLILEAK